MADVDTFLYYCLGIDSTILVTLSEIGVQQSTATTDTEKKFAQLMYYLHNHPDAVVRFHASDMILYIESDSAYLVLPKARSRVASIFYLSNATSGRPPLNGAMQVICKTLHKVVSSAAKAETGGIFVGGQQAVPIITALSELNHQQPASGTCISNDNSTAKGVLTANLRQNLSKAFDMRYWCIKDRIKQRQFKLVWEPGKQNRADYFTKHFPPKHHLLQRHIFLQQAKINQTARVCYSVNHYEPLQNRLLRKPLQTVTNHLRPKLL